MATELLKPALAQVGVIAIVWSWMFIDRLRSMLKNGVKMEDLRTRAGEGRIQDAINSADNFENLFEVPVLFFVLVTLLIQAGSTDPIYVTGAWIFVGSRALHSLIHCTLNHIGARFTVYFAGTLVLWAMWGRFATQLLWD